MKNEKLAPAELVKELLRHEKNETKLVALYQGLLDGEVAVCLTSQEKRLFQETLATLVRDSQKHMRLVADLAAKINKE